MILEAGNYYKINGTKRILYWDGEKWLKPAKDTIGRIGTWVAPLEKQPNVKSAEMVDVNKLPY